MSVSHKEQAEAIEREKALLRGQNIDRAMDHAAQLYQQASSHDPYAMHKAVESLPASVLALLLQQKLDAELCSRPSPIKAGIAHLQITPAILDQMKMSALANAMFPTKFPSRPWDLQFEAFIKYFHSLPHVDADKTNLMFVRSLFQCYYEARNITAVMYKRGSGATTVVQEWLKWMKPNVLVIADGKRLLDSYNPFAKVRTWQQSIKGLRPDFCIIEDHAFNNSVSAERRFLEFVQGLPFSGIWLQAYER